MAGVRENRAPVADDIPKLSNMQKLVLKLPQVNPKLESFVVSFGNGLTGGLASWAGEKLFGTDYSKIEPSLAGEILASIYPSSIGKNAAIAAGRFGARQVGRGMKMISRSPVGQKVQRGLNEVAREGWEEVGKLKRKAGKFLDEVEDSKYTRKIYRKLDKLEDKLEDGLEDFMEFSPVQHMRRALEHGQKKALNSGALRTAQRKVEQGVKAVRSMNTDQALGHLYEFGSVLNTAREAKGNIDQAIDQTPEADLIRTNPDYAKWIRSGGDPAEGRQMLKDQWSKQAIPILSSVALDRFEVGARGGKLAEFATNTAVDVGKAGLGEWMNNLNTRVQYNQNQSLSEGVGNAMAIEGGASPIRGSLERMLQANRR